jgi:DNA-binding MarR family transcriptional regulator
LTEHLKDGSCRDFRHSIYLVVHAAARLTEMRTAFAEGISVAPNQFLILMCIAYQSETHGLSIAALANELGLASTHVTTDVGRLTRAGLLKKRPHETDKRSVLVTLTDQGRAAIEKVAPLVQFVNDILFNDVSREERETMSRVALKLIRNGERAATELRIRSLGEISESNNR